MAALCDLPNETLILILSFLSAFDLRTALLAQRVSRRFRDLIQDVVFYSAPATRAHLLSESAVGISGAEIHPLLQAKFKGLFNSIDCFTLAEQVRFWVRTPEGDAPPPGELRGDATLPFRRLPWAVGSYPARRDAFLRPEASWRELSPTFGSSPPIRSLEVVKCFESDTVSPGPYFQVELPPSGLNMGLLYDVLLCEEALYGTETESWQLIIGKSLKSFDVLYEWDCLIIDGPGESELVREECDAAILYVTGGEGRSRTMPDQNEWMPQRLAKNSRPKFLPWQGPLKDLE